MAKRFNISVQIRISEEFCSYLGGAALFCCSKIFGNLDCKSWNHILLPFKMENPHLRQIRIYLYSLLYYSYSYYSNNNYSNKLLIICGSAVSYLPLRDCAGSTYCCSADSIHHKTCVRAVAVVDQAHYACPTRQHELQYVRIRIIFLCARSGIDMP